MTVDNPKIEYMHNRQHRVSLVCLVLCGIFMLVLGVLPKIPSAVTQVLRPIFLFFI